MSGKIKIDEIEEDVAIEVGEMTLRRMMVVYDQFIRETLSWEQKNDLKLRLRLIND